TGRRTSSAPSPAREHLPGTLSGSPADAAFLPGGARPKLDSSAASQESSDGGHHLFGPVVLLFAFGADHARMRVPIEQPERDLVQGGLRGADLSEDVDAVPIVGNHAL